MPNPKARTTKRKLLHEVREQKVTIEQLRQTVADERLKRTAAQRGLVPYVSAVQALNAWLEDWYGYTNDDGARTSDIPRHELEGQLKKLGLFGVRVGYDPDKDVAISVIAANRA